MALTPLGRHGSPQDIANLIAFLSSDEASFITGETVTITGGRYMAPEHLVFRPGMTGTSKVGRPFMLLP
ncbi:MAG: SDR family oxidoreductase [Dehalococcoidia bacterium]|nr:SDR family oxidoreductase [Dehalococcoidia bacterium]